MDFADMMDDLSATHDIPPTPTETHDGSATPRERKDPFTAYSDAEFKLHYRFAKETVRVLIELLEEKLSRQTNRHCSLSTATQVFLALRFAASGSFLREDADHHGVGISTPSAVIHRVFEAIAEMRPSFIKYPTPEELPGLEKAFYQKKGVPGVVGAVDGTHIRISRPTTEDCERYRNRKGWFSINTQLMCDDKLRIRNVVASWPGSAHDSRIFNESSLKTSLEQLPPKYHILGDQGYPNTPYLLIPVPDPSKKDSKKPPPSREERRYNGAHSSTRMDIERVNGILKRRFPCLDRKLRFTPEKCGVIIVACCVLHNLALMQNDEWDADEVELGTSGEDVDVDYGDGSGTSSGTNQTAAGVAKRAAIIRQYFS